MTAYRTAVVVLNWNNAPDTLECLDSLYPLLDGETRLIVCDNASADDSPARLLAWAEAHPSAPFLFIRTGRNLGFAGGMNAGIRHALAEPGLEFLWLLNNDTTVAADSLRALRECARRRPEIALFGPSVLEAARPEILQCAGGCRYYPLLTVFRDVFAGLPLAEALGRAPPRLDYVYGAAMFLRAEAMRRVGLLNEDYFLFYEELDYTRRLRRAGYGIVWCAESRVWHKGSASVGKPGQASRAKRSLANYHENLSTLKYTANFHPRLLWPVMGLRFVLKSLVLLLRREFYLFPPLWRAYRDFRVWRKNRE